jgi:hypothetical protein
VMISLITTISPALLLKSRFGIVSNPLLFFPELYYVC